MTIQAPRRPDASMSLINEVLNRPLDPGYAAAAERRRLAGEGEEQPLRSPVVLVTVLVIGLIFGISVMTIGPRTTERSAARQDLVAQIEARRERVEANTARVNELQEEVALAQEQIVRDSAGLEAAGLTSALLASAGATGVTGPGLIITLDDAPVEPGADRGAPNEGKVLSRDLQIVVNALWAAGAEAIDVGGQRLTSRSAIRFAGEAILVNYRPLTRPYVVRAIGNPEALTTRFAGGDGGAYVKTLTDNFGITSTVTVTEEITMKSASALRTDHARPIEREESQ
ncbi:MAG: DUF881 domain-containing protein [Actinomycetales bacterium]|nr:DUF881 domain-containing protein [Tetrasphaera sp.]NLX00161.1 DUF881 domain-containing protein [Actinomycetales bacterium]